MNPLADLGFVEIDSQEDISQNQQDTNLSDLGFQEVERQENVPQKIARQVGRTALRGAETIAGLPGDIQRFAEFIGSSLGSGLRSLAGQEPIPPEEIERRQSIAKGVTPNLPGQEQLQQVSEAAFGEFAKPQTEAEEFSDEITKDFASLALPVKGKIPFARALGTTLFANVGKELVKDLGGSDTAQGATKLGLMTLAAMMGRSNANQYAKDLYKNSIKSIPENAVIEAESIAPELRKFTSRIKKGGLTPQKAPALRLARQLEGKIVDGKIPVKELPAFRASINEYRFDRTLGDKARYHLDRFEDVIQKGLEKYGNQNPEFMKQYKDANIAYSGMKQAGRLQRLIGKNVNVSDLSPLTAIALGLGGSLESAAIKLAAASPLGFMKKFTTNPVLRRHYLDVMKSAAKEDTVKLTRNINLLDRAIRKEDSE